MESNTEALLMTNINNDKRRKVKRDVTIAENRLILQEHAIGVARRMVNKMNTGKKKEYEVLATVDT